MLCLLSLLLLLPLFALVWLPCYPVYGPVHPTRIVYVSHQPCPCAEQGQAPGTPQAK